MSMLKAEALNRSLIAALFCLLNYAERFKKRSSQTLANVQMQSFTDGHGITAPRFVRKLAAHFGVIQRYISAT